MDPRKAPEEVPVTFYDKVPKETQVTLINPGNTLIIVRAVV